MTEIQTIEGGQKDVSSLEGTKPLKKKKTTHLIDSGNVFQTEAYFRKIFVQQQIFEIKDVVIIITEISCYYYSTFAEII